MDEFLTDYPVVLSTCHSLRNSLDARRLLDYLVIDEASQLDLATAALVLASCRRVVIVGDLRQLPHIPNGTAAEQAGTAPHPAFDYRTHNALSSFTAYYRESLPKTVLREHYRCHPAIIGFCNQKFYDGILIPHSDAAPAPNALTLHPTAPGNHMRQFTRGGRINRREVEVIEREVLPRLLEEFTREEIGITTPYRRQVSVVADTLLSELAAIEADTVHRYQGREKDAIVMTTVLDESEQGRRGLTFVDDPRLINVAVSRAKRRFVLVTDNEMLPTSRHLRDLIGYIRYQNPEEDPPESGVVSVFDLLYQKYSEKLRTLADRVSGPSRFTSENIIWTVLHDILAEDSYAGLTVTPQVLLRTLVPRLAELTPEQAAYVQHRASLDFVVYNGVTKLPLLAIEVDGFAYHDDDVQQLARDELKNAILRSSRIPLLRLSTIGSAERQRICSALDKALVADVGGRA